MSERAADGTSATPEAPDRLDALRTTAITTIREHVPQASRWVAVDYPMHWNVGDAAITLGQAQIAAEQGVRTTRVLDRRSYRTRLLGDDTLPVIAGGGNWGGLYPTHHRLRLRVLEDTRGRDVVQMPQSIHYASEQSREELRRAVGRHGRLKLLVRDRRSFDIAARDYDCDVHLVPDLVLTLGRLQATPPRVDVVLQARTDKEAPADAPAAGAFDWLVPPLRSTSRAALRAATLTNRAQLRLPGALGGQPNVLATSALAKANLRRGLALLAHGRYVVTDRLHGHVLAHQLARPHVVVDDRFGKIRALHETWLADDPRSILVASWSHAPAALSRLRERFPDG